MESVYRVDVIPAYKPWRGNGTYLIKDKEVFDLFADGAWLPDVQLSELPEKYRYLALEPVYDYETDSTTPYVPTGREDWENLVTIDENGDEVELEVSISNILASADCSIEFPYILLDSSTVFCE